MRLRPNMIIVQMAPCYKAHIMFQNAERPLCGRPAYWQHATQLQTASSAKLCSTCRKEAVKQKKKWNAAAKKADKYKLYGPFDGRTVIRLRKTRSPFCRDDEFEYSLLEDATEEERYLLRHCLSSLYGSGGTPGDPTIFSDKLPFAQMLIEAHNAELEIIEG